MRRRNPLDCPINKLGQLWITGNSRDVCLRIFEGKYLRGNERSNIYCRVRLETAIEFLFIPIR